MNRYPVFTRTCLVTWPSIAAGIAFSVALGAVTAVTLFVAMVWVETR